MGPYFLADRATALTERMDAANCNKIALFNTYRQFSTVNSLLSGWKSIFRSAIAPLLEQQSTVRLLDIGFGGGDIPLKMARWAQEASGELQITAIETDPRALEFVKQRSAPPTVAFIHSSAHEIAQNGSTFDVVISNHLVHHLNRNQLHSLLADAQRLATHTILFNDIERSDWAYGLFNIFSRPLFNRSFITEDGLTSIRRSYTAHELRKVVPKGWNVRRKFPFRLLLEYSHQENRS